MFNLRQHELLSIGMCTVYTLIFGVLVRHHKEEIESITFVERAQYNDIASWSTYWNSEFVLYGMLTCEIISVYCHVIKISQKALAKKVV